MTIDPQVERARRVFEEIHRPLWRAVLAFSGSREVADDAVAEAFAQLLRRGDEVANPSAWVRRAAFRIAAGELADRSRRGDPTMPEVGQSDNEPAVDLLRALEDLPMQQRGGVVLCDLVGFTAAEAAELLGTSAAVVRVQRMRARRRLRERLEDRDG